MTNVLVLNRLNSPFLNGHLKFYLDGQEVRLSEHGFAKKVFADTTHVDIEVKSYFASKQKQITVEGVEDVLVVIEPDSQIVAKINRLFYLTLLILGSVAFLLGKDHYFFKNHYFTMLVLALIAIKSAAKYVFDNWFLTLRLVSSPLKVVVF